MNYDILNRMIEDTGCVKLYFLEGVLNTLYYDQRIGDDYEPFEKVTILKQLVQSNEVEGDKNLFHNVAVTCARGDDYKFACLIIDEGLKQYPYDVDLLADYLAYGLKGGNSKRCNEVFNRILSIKDRWNWRAYSFTIDYLLDYISKVKYDSDVRDIYERIDNLTSEYIERIRDREDPFCSRYDFIDKTVPGDEKITKGQDILLQAVNSGTLKRAPKALLRLADNYYDNGQVLKANEMIERCKLDSLEIQPSVSRTYVYLLSTMCKISLVYELSKGKTKKITDDEPESEREKYLMEAYEDFHVACIDFADTRVKNLKTVIRTVVRETGKPYPYDDIDET